MSQSTKPRNPDHGRRTNRPSVDDAVIEERIESLLTPAGDAQLGSYRQLGHRNRILGRAVMVAAVAMLIWRQVPSVGELAKMLAREEVFWVPRVKVSQQALSKRFLNFPAEIFKRVLMDLLPKLRERWAVRQRPLPDSVVCAQKHFSRTLAVDGSSPSPQTPRAPRCARRSFGGQDLHGN